MSLQTAKQLAHAMVVEAAQEVGVDLEHKPKAPKAARNRRKVTELPVEEPKAEKKAKELKVEEVRPVCSCLKKDGKPCSAKAMRNVTYCTDHRPGILHLQQVETGKLEEYLGVSYEQLTRVVEAFGWGKAQVIARKLIVEGL